MVCNKVSVYGDICNHNGVYIVAFGAQRHEVQSTNSDLKSPFHKRLLNSRFVFCT